MRGSGGRSHFYGGSGPGSASTRAFATRTLVRRALLPRVGPKSAASLREQSERTDRRSPATRVRDWGDLSRCPRARFRRRRTGRVVCARESDNRSLLAPCEPAQARTRPSPSHPGTHRGHVVVFRRRVFTRRCFAPRERTRAGSQRSPFVAGTYCGDPVVSPARGSAAFRVCARHPPAAPRRPPPYLTRTASLASAHRLPWFLRRPRS